MYSQILTGEDWNVVMYDGIQAYGGVKVSEDTGSQLSHLDIISELWFPRLLLLHILIHLR